MIALAPLVLGFLSPQQESSDWPQFQGPSGDGTTEWSGPKFEDMDEEPQVAWRTAVGGGYGGAAIRDGEVFLLDRVIGEKDVLRVFDLESGEESWSASYEAPGRLNFPGSRTVPAVLEDHVYTAGGFSHVSCFDRKTHELVWSVNMAEEYGGQAPMFGWSSAPIVHGSVVIVTPLGEEVGLLALDRATGEKVWSTPSVGYSHSTPTILNLLGETQVVFLSTLYQTSGRDQSAPTTIWGFDPETGEELWRTDTTLTRLPIPGPVQIDANRFFVTGGYRGGSTLLRIDERDGTYVFEELFHIDRGAQIHRPLLYEDHLYVLVNENWNESRGRRKEGGLLCLSLEGEEVWRTEDSPFFGRGNAILAGGYLLIQDGHSGVLRIVRPTPKRFQLLVEVDLFGMEDERDHQMWAPMALSGRNLLMRSQEELICARL